MCQFGNSSKILEELNLTEEQALVGWRNNIITNSFNDKDKYLKALSNAYLYPKNYVAVGDPTRKNSTGIYNNNNYNNNNNNNNNNYNYNVQVKTVHWGKVFRYKEGYRSQYCRITHIVILDRESKWFTDKNTKSFAEHFNNLCEHLAGEYNCEVLEWSKR